MSRVVNCNSLVNFHTATNGIGVEFEARCIFELLLSRRIIFFLPELCFIHPEFIEGRCMM